MSQEVQTEPNVNNAPVQMLNYCNTPVRMLEIDGEPWFVLKDVCEILGIANTTQAAARLDEDERSMFNIGRQGEVNVINESGLYNVILRSDKPEAKPFRKWVTSEVLPSIRKTGEYRNTQARASSRDEIERMKAETVRMKAENARLELETRAKQLEIAQRNSEHKAEMERETQARLAEKERLKAEEAKRRDKRNDAEQLLKLIQSKRIFGKPLAEVISKFYELSVGEEFSSEALNELFTVTKEQQLDAYPKICNIVHEKAEMFDNLVWGKFSTDRKTVYILKSEFDKLCQKADVPIKPMLAWLGEKGLIELDAQGQYTKPVSIKGRLARCVVMRLDANA